MTFQGDQKFLIPAGLLFLTGYGFVGHFGVRRIKITDDKIRFLPIGVTMSLCDFEAVTEVMFSSFGTIPHIRLRAKAH